MIYVNCITIVDTNAADNNFLYLYSCSYNSRV